MIDLHQFTPKYTKRTPTSSESSVFLDKKINVLKTVKLYELS